MKAKKMIIGLAVVIALLITIGSALAVSPELEITDIEVGKTGGSFESYLDGAETASFQPGDQVTFKVKVKNNGSATLEDVKVNIVADGDLTNFPTSHSPAEISLLANQEKEVTFTYTLPITLNTYGESNYAIELLAEGVGVHAPPNEYESPLRSVLLKVEQEWDNIYVNGVEYDSSLTCAEKQQSSEAEVKVKLVNNGLEPETDVIVTLTSQTLGLNEEKIATVFQGTEKTVTFSIDSAAVSGNHQFTVKVSREGVSEIVYDTEINSISGETCAVSITGLPSASSVAFKENSDPQQFSVTVSNPGEVALTYQWFVDTDNQNDNDTSFTFDPEIEGVGDYLVKVTVTGTNVNLNKQWTVKVSDRPVDASQFPGTSTTNLNINTVPDIENVSGFTLDNGFGKIAFTQNVDLSEILYLADVVSITDSKVMVNSNLAPELNKPATITIKKDFDDPVIQKLDESTNTFVDCSTCSLVSKSCGLVVFTVPGFSTYQVTEDDAGFLTVSKVEINGKTTGDLSLSEINEIEVEISNKYTKNINDITLKVRILEEDGDEIAEEKVDKFDLSNGDEETKTVEFDLSNEDLNDDKYTLEVEVEGEASDDTTHSDTHTQTVDVDRSDNDIAITKAELSNNNLVCSSRTSLRVTVKNNGEDDYQDAMLRVRNNVLNLDLSKSNIYVEDYTSDDDEYQATFEVDVADAAAGTYSLDVDLLDEDDDLLDSEQVELFVKGCGGAASGENQEYYADAALTAELQKKLAEREMADQTTIKASFRESEQYTLLLGVLVVMMIVAAVLSMVVMLVKKR